MATLFAFTRVPNPRFSYTYKDTHPVFCSYISDECLFYKKYNDQGWDEPEDHDNTDPVLLELEKHISALRSKNRVAEDKLENLLVHNPMDLVKDNFKYSLPWDLDRLSTLLNSVAIGKKLTRGINAIKVGPVKLAELHGDLLLVNNKRCIYEVAIAAIKTIRVSHNPVKLYDVDGQILYKRLIEADSHHWMFRWAWEKHLSGDSYPLSLYASNYYPLAKAGVREAMGDFRSLKSGICGRGIIETWFLEEYPRAIDKLTVTGMLATYPVDVKWLPLPYEAVYEVTELAGETNPLSGFVSAVMTDPVFTTVRDRAMANMAWFLKFERSFKNG